MLERYHPKLPWVGALQDDENAPIFCSKQRSPELSSYISATGLPRALDCVAGEKKNKKIKKKSNSSRKENLAHCMIFSGKLDFSRAFGSRQEKV